MVQKKPKRIITIGVILLIIIGVISLLKSSAPEEQALGACSMFFWLIIGVIVLNIALLVWVAKDAKNRGMDSAVIWMLLVLFTGILGLVIYLLSRPKGELVLCKHCENKKLKYAKVCPHCKHETLTK